MTTHSFLLCFKVLRGGDSIFSSPLVSGPDARLASLGHDTEPPPSNLPLDLGAVESEKECIRFFPNKADDDHVS